MTMRAMDYNGHMPETSDMTHAQFQAAVVQLLDDAGVRYFLPACLERGCPDLFVLGRTGSFWRELKTDWSSLTREQSIVGHEMRAVRVGWKVWRPRDLASGMIAREVRDIGGISQKV